MALFEKLNDENLKDVTGGYQFQHRWGNERSMVYEAIDDKTGDVVATFSDRDECYRYCKSNGLKIDHLSWEQLQGLREYGHI